jgi:drug/metabolite transporter (DMT)-like permease
MQKNIKLSSELALIIWIFLGSLMWVIIRFLSEYFLVYQQIFFRSFFAFFLWITIFWILFWKIDLSKIKRKDFLFILLRSIILFLGTVFYVLAINNAKLVNIGFIWAVPTTAIIGIVFMKEKLNLKKAFYLLLSILWVLMILVKDFSSFEFWLWETYALISAFLFSIWFLIRKKIWKKIANTDIVIVSVFCFSIYSFLASIIFEESISKMLSRINFFSFIYIILWAFLFVWISFFAIYWFKKITAIKATSIEFLEAVFSLIFWFLFFQEIPELFDIFWWTLIIIWAYLMVRNKRN